MFELHILCLKKKQNKTFENLFTSIRIKNINAPLKLNDPKRELGISDSEYKRFLDFDQSGFVHIARIAAAPAGRGS